MVVEVVASGVCFLRLLRSLEFSRVRNRFLFVISVGLLDLFTVFVVSTFSLSSASSSIISSVLCLGGVLELGLFLDFEEVVDGRLPDDERDETLFLLLGFSLDFLELLSELDFAVSETRFLFLVLFDPDFLLSVRLLKTDLFT